MLAVFRNLQGQEQQPLLSVEMQALRLQLRTMNQNRMSPWSDLIDAQSSLISFGWDLGRWLSL